MAKFSFNARAHILKLLGDELIGSDKLAVFELVKNSYDADATKVNVTLDIDNGVIIIDDNGTGMSHSTIRNKWLELATNSKRGVNRKRSEKYNRLPLGEKGVGRLAAHKLGRKLELHSKSLDKYEVYFSVDWESLIESSEYIQDAYINLIRVKPQDEKSIFSKTETGTKIIISDLYNTEWNRRDVRSLYKIITSLVTPFKTIDSFSVSFYIPGYEHYISDLRSHSEIIKESIWQFEFLLTNKAVLQYRYTFAPPKNFRSLKNNSSTRKERLTLLPFDEDDQVSRNHKFNGDLLLSPEELDGIGPVSGKIYVFDRRKIVLQQYNHHKEILDYLKTNSGIRLYKSGIRIFNYGEPSDDWLQLNMARINSPSEKIGTNNIIGGISLTAQHCFNLTEKTNREGFDENNSFYMLRHIMKSIMEKFNIIRLDDRKKLDMYLKGVSNPIARKEEKFDSAIESIKVYLDKSLAPESIKGKVHHIETEYKRMRSVFAQSTYAGMNIGLVFHEVEGAVKDLHQFSKTDVSKEVLFSHIQRLADLVEGLNPLLRKDDVKTIDAMKFLQTFIEMKSGRFNKHNVIISIPVIQNEEPSFTFKGGYNLIFAALSNLIDNAIYWSCVKYEMDNKKGRPAISIRCFTDWFQEGPAIVVTDNGEGLDIDEESAILPFVTSRVGGAGLGLYLSEFAMTSVGGKLYFLDDDEKDGIGIDKSIYTGASVAMIFDGGNNGK